MARPVGLQPPVLILKHGPAVQTQPRSYGRGPRLGRAADRAPPEQKHERLRGALCASDSPPSMSQRRRPEPGEPKLVLRQHELELHARELDQGDRELGLRHWELRLRTAEFALKLLGPGLLLILGLADRMNDRTGSVGPRIARLASGAAGWM